MTRLKVFLPILAAALVLVAAFGVFTYRTVFAQTPTPTVPGTIPQQNGKAAGEKLAMKDEYLAEALGITVDQLNAAQQTALDEALKQAVAQGLITQDQADRLAQRDVRGLGGIGAGLLEQNGIDYQALLAQALNISADDLKAAQVTAQNAAIENAVTAGKITQEQADLMKGRLALKNDTTFQSALKSAYEAAINQAVQSGVISQAQADALLNQANQNGGGFFPFGGGHDGFGGGRHHKGGGGFGPNQTTPSTEPTPEGSGL